MIIENIVNEEQCELNGLDNQIKQACLFKYKEILLETM